MMIKTESSTNYKNRIDSAEKRSGKKIPCFFSADSVIIKYGRGKKNQGKRSMCVILIYKLTWNYLTTQNRKFNIYCNSYKKTNFIYK